MAHPLWRTMSDSKEPFLTHSAVVIFPHQKLFGTAGPQTGVLQTQRGA